MQAPVNRTGVRSVLEEFALRMIGREWNSDDRSQALNTPRAFGCHDLLGPR